MTTETTTYRNRSPKPIGSSFYPAEFWQNMQDWAESPWLQRISANAAGLDARTQRFLAAYIGALDRSVIGGIDFDDSFDGQLGEIGDDLLTTDARIRERALQRFEAWVASKHATEG